MVMSKKVASAYLEKVATVTSTLTVYFTDESQLQGFLESVKAAHGKRVSCSRGFDYLTFLSEDKEVVTEVQEWANERGLDFSGF